MHIKDFDPYDFSKAEVEGVPVYYKNLPWSPCVHIRFQFSSGAFADPVGKEGLAHFLEHLIGNGSPSLPDKKSTKEFSRLYMLNSRNAITSYYWTSYVGKCLPEHFETVFKTMKEYVFEPFLRQDDVEHERKVITQEAWGRYKNEKFLKYIKELNSNIYHGHVRSRITSPLGWPATVAKITQSDIKNFHKENYVKENLTVIIVGAFEESHLETVEEVLKNLPTGKRLAVNTGKLSKPHEMRVESYADDIGFPREQVEISMERATNDSSNEDDEVMTQARMLLYDTLYERLRLEHSLCYGVSVGWGRYKDYREVVLTLDTARDKLALSEKEMWQVINEIISGKWRDRFATIHKLAIDQIRSRERQSDFVIESTGNDLATHNKIVTLREILEAAGKVTYEDVARLMKQTFDPDKIFTSVIFPGNAQGTKS